MQATITITVWGLFITFSFGMLPLLRITLNGIMPVQKSTSDICLKAIKEKLKDEYNELEKILSDHSHGISLLFDKYDFLTGKFYSIFTIILLNIFFFSSYWINYVSVSNNCSASTSEKIFLNPPYMPIGGVIIAIASIAYCLQAIYKVDNYDRLLKISRVRDLKKLIKRH